MLHIAFTAHGLCWLGFEETEINSRYLMKKRFAGAHFTEDNAAAQAWSTRITHAWSGVDVEEINLDLYGTAFQISVWKALLKITNGKTKSYGDVALDIGKKKNAARAVGGAVGSNPISILIPCHRVIQHNGNFENYLWGSAKKKNLLGAEGVL